MKSIKYAVILLLLFSINSFAQSNDAPPPGPPPRDGKMDDKIQSMKIAFITQQLDLTPEESQKFWPVFNQFEKEMKALRDNRKDGPPNFDSMNDKEVEKFVDDEVMRRQKEIDVMKKYNAQFKQVLPIRKVAKLYGAQEAFKHELLQKLQQHRQGGPGGPPPGDRK